MVPEIVGALRTVPDAATFTVVAPLAEIATFPEGVPVALLDILTYTVVALSVPLDGVNETEEL